MWDMMLYGGAPYSRRCRRSRRSSKKGRKCRVCKEHIGKVTVGGKKVDMVYCENHHCQKILANGSVCQEQRNGRNPLWKYCDLHLRCQAPGSDDMPCMKYVKDADPEKFKYCSDHGCRYPHCEQTKHEGSKGYCPQHSCLANKARKDACDQPRLVQDGSPFCERHTCEWPTCTAEAEGRGERGDAGRSCEQHRWCAAEGCACACFRRDTGAVLRWCGLHYCHRDPCPEPRAPGSERFCDRHVCVEPACGAGRKEEVTKRGGRFCADHQCRADGCLERRDMRARGAEYCALHICWVEGCPRPPAAAAAENHRCEIHQECREGGCREYIFVEKGSGEDIRYPTCENHHKPRCPASTPGGTQCDKRLDSGQRYCRNHSCELSSCGDQRRPDSLQYCPAHRCAAPACQQLRKNTIAGLVRPDDLLMLAGGGGGGTASRASLLFSLAAGGGGGGGLVAPLSSYCSAHACQGDGGRCGERAGEVGGSDGGGGGGGLFCARHGCSRRGCVREGSHQPRRKGGGRSSKGGLCDRHYKKRKGGGGGVGGPPVGAFGPMGIPTGIPTGMPMGLPMGFPPFFGGQVYDSSDYSDSDSDDERRLRGLPFGGAFL